MNDEKGPFFNNYPSVSVQKQPVTHIYDMLVESVNISDIFPEYWLWFLSRYILLSNQLAIYKWLIHKFINQLAIYKWLIHKFITLLWLPRNLFASLHEDAVISEEGFASDFDLCNHMLIACIITNKQSCGTVKALQLISVFTQCEKMLKESEVVKINSLSMH